MYIKPSQVAFEDETVVVPGAIAVTRSRDQENSASFDRRLLLPDGRPKYWRVQSSDQTMATRWLEIFVATHAPTRHAHLSATQTPIDTIVKFETLTTKFVYLIFLRLWIVCHLYLLCMQFSLPTYKFQIKFEVTKFENGCSRHL